MGTFTKLLKGVVPLTHYPYVGDQISCSLCGSDHKQTLCTYDRRIKKLTTVICMNCGLLRTDPMPSDDELSEYYRLSYRFDYQLAGSKPPAFHLKRSMDNAAKRLGRLAPVIGSGARLLDFGSGSGELLAVAKENGCDVTGIEPGQTYAEFAKETYGVKMFSDAWQNVDLGTQKFDVITSFHVFEHLRDPLAAMQWLTDHLETDGTITIAVPNMLPSDGGLRLFERVHFAHVHGFTPKTLALLGAACGLEPDPRVKPRGTDIVFRHAANPNAFQPNPDEAKSLAQSYDNVNVFGHLLRLGWVGDAFRRARKDLRDSRSHKKN